MSTIDGLKVLEYQEIIHQYMNHQLALNYFKTGDFLKQDKYIKVPFDSNNYNIYISSLMSDIL